MKKIMLNFDEMSDSKEVYGQRPNPFITGFIYSLVGVLIIAIIYSCVGKIEIVTTASGIVRPNDSISTVSSFLDGRVDGVYYADGQNVKKGDVLLKIDTSDKQTSLDALKDKKAEYIFQNKMCEKFLKGIEEQKNPFSNNPENDEYTYHVKYEDYELSLNNSKQTIVYDAEKNEADLQTVKSQISELENRLKGLVAYRDSVEKGENLASNYPDYERLYLSYASAIEKLDNDYMSQKESILRDTTEDSNELVLKQYETMATEYNCLVTSIQEGKSFFPDDDKSVCRLLYDNYQTTLENYEDTYLSAKDTYEKYLERDVSSDESFALNTIPSEQVINDVSKPETDNLSPTDDYIETAKQQMENAKTAVETYKTKTLAEYQQILNDYENKIAEVKLKIASLQDRESQLLALEESYNNSKDQQYHQTITQIDSSIQSAKTELNSAQSSLRLCQISSTLYEDSKDENGIPLSISQTIMQETSTILSQQETLKNQMDELDTQITQITEQIKKGTICAEQSGVISVNATLAVGDLITAGTVIATVLPINQSEYKMNLYVNNVDVANIKVGDSVRYNLAALPSSQYGVAEGTVLNISSDTLVQNGEYSGYYLVECSLNNKQFADDDGNEGTVLVGMQFEAKIVTQEKTIIRYLLEKIDLF